MTNQQINSKSTTTTYVPTAEFYSQIVESLQDYAIFTTDNQFVINSWSAGAKKIFGWDGDEIIGKQFEVIFTDEDRQNKIPRKEIDIAHREGRATDNRWHICKNESVFYASGLVFPLVSIEGELLGYVKILRDLTDRKKSEGAIKTYVKELEDLNTHKESVLAILSHDLRSPLSSIIATTGYLKNNFERMDTAAVKAMLEMLHKAAVDELDMLDYLVEWARIKYAAEVFSPRKIELTSYVQKVFATLQDTASLNTINLHCEVEENTAVFADGKMLLSVIQNIVSNAIKHSSPGGEISVSAKTMEDKIIVQIKDSGSGMSKEIQDKLFTPQMHLLAKARNENKGAGIGLLLVKGFLEKNGGEIWVESVEGVGSSFYFTLPIDEPYKIDSSE